jgi:anion-transporting  ArsA/GET3 family ATPase
VNVAEILAGKRVVVCAGSGGVGKTTTAAAVALGMAAGGAKVALVTIDPAKRLAGALGLDTLDNEPRRVDSRRLAGVTMDGEIWAMMLDPKRTFDDLIDNVAPTAERAAEIKANRIYSQLSTAVAGSQEFTAVSKLYELSESGRFDLIVLDTPPARNALDFFDAPARLEAFLEGGALKALLRPTTVGMRLFAKGAAPVLGALRRVTGVDVTTDLATFFALLGGMTDSFGMRARQVDLLLHAPTTAFLLVTSPQAGPTDDAIAFRRTLADGGLPFGGAIVNRAHPPLAVARTDYEPHGVDAGLAELELPGVDATLAAKLAATVSEYVVLAARDAANIARLRAALDGAPVLLVPEFGDDVDDVHGLVRIHRELFG